MQIEKVLDGKVFLKCLLRFPNSIDEAAELALNSEDRISYKSMKGR